MRGQQTQPVLCCESAGERRLSAVVVAGPEGWNTGLLWDGIVVVFLDAIASLLIQEFREVTFLNLLMVFLYVLSVLIDWKTG